MPTCLSLRSTSRWLESCIDNGVEVDFVVFILVNCRVMGRLAGSDFHLDPDGIHKLEEGPHVECAISSFEPRDARLCCSQPHGKLLLREARILPALPQRGS